MYISTKSHGEKIFHNQFCTYAKRIKPENIIEVETTKKFRKMGYRACNCCSFMGKKYKAECEELQSYAKRNYMKIWLEDDAVYVETNIAAWKITQYSTTQNICLLHANTENYRFLAKKNGKIIHTYHMQGDIRSKTIMGYLQYIKRHDEWRTNIMNEYKSIPVSTKRQRKQNKNARINGKKKAVCNVLNMLEVLRVEREYREKCCN